MHECQAVAASALREGVLPRKVTQKGVIKQGMQTKEGHFVFLFHLLPQHFPAFSEEEQEQGLMFP